MYIINYIFLNKFWDSLSRLIFLVTSLRDLSDLTVQGIP